MRIICSFSWVLISFSCSYGMALSNRPCLQTKDCPDSGSVCVLPGGVAKTVNNDKISGFNPSTADDYIANGVESPFDREVPELEDAPISAARGVDSSHLHVGDTVFLNKYPCKVLNTNNPGLTEPTYELSDAPDSGTDLPDSFQMGQIVKQDNFVCKIVQVPGGPTTRKQATTTSTNKPIPKNPTTEKPKLGVCKCDFSQRFPCDTTDECVTRMRNKDIVCIRSSGCPNPIAGGYCRLPGPAVLNDDGSGLQ